MPNSHQSTIQPIKTQPLLVNKIIRKRLILVVCLILVVFVGILILTNSRLQPFGTVKVWDKNGTLLFESDNGVGRKETVSFEEIPPNFINAVVAAEDDTFWSNPGVDFSAILRSGYQFLASGKVLSGASTVTQQVARASIIAPRASAPRTVSRKIREILTALFLTIRYPKNEILRLYCSDMYFGKMSYGINSAARSYFDKNSTNLSLSETTFLAGKLAYPDSDDTKAQERQRYVLDRMVEMGFITISQRNDALNETLVFRDGTEKLLAPHFIQHVLDEYKNMGISVTDGVNIYTSLDYQLFAESERIAQRHIGNLSDEHHMTNAAIVILNNRTGEILSMVGGVNYGNEKYSGSVNMATALRQPGSALKPITYAAAFTKGYTPATLLFDVKKVFITRKGEGYAPNNYDGRFHGLVLAREALASSFNVPAVEMLEKVGIEPFLKTAQDLGITTLTETDRYDLSLTLGGGEVTLLDLTNAYASFGREGEFIPVHAIVKITSDNGKTIYEYKKPSPKIALGEKSRQVAYLISDILSDPKARIPSFGEKNPLVLKWPAAVKTGTTTDWHDIWTIGYTPSFSVGVWAGNNDNAPMVSISGIEGAAPIWNETMTELLKTRPQEDFVRPLGISDALICKLSGLADDGLCPEKITEHFIEGTKPQGISSLHKTVSIDVRNGLLAGENCDGKYVENRLMVDYPAETHSWALAENMPLIPATYSPYCPSEAHSKEEPYLTIINPREKAVFETAPKLVANEALQCEVSFSASIESVVWHLGDVVLDESKIPPFTYALTLKTGEYILKAVGMTTSGEKVESHAIHFSVFEYKADQ